MFHMLEKGRSRPLGLSISYSLLFKSEEPLRVSISRGWQAWGVSLQPRHVLRVPEQCHATGRLGARIDFGSFGVTAAKDKDEGISR